MLGVLTSPRCRITAEKLESLLNASKYPSQNGYVYWGISGKEKNSLNSKAGSLNKFEQGKRLIEKGVPSIAYLTKEAASRSESFPLFGRTFSHRAGKDITIALQPEDVALRQGVDYYTKFEPFTEEYRIWVYRNSHLGTYKKTLNRPELYRKPGRNYHNGWAFCLVGREDVPRDAVGLAANAVSALDLDFGGVDIGKARNGSYKVIEVNSAPSVQSSKRQVLQKLAAHINLWHDNNFPKRRAA